MADNVLITPASRKIQFYESTANGTNYVALVGPTSIAADVSWVLPSAAGANGQLLSTDGSNNLSWTTKGTGTVDGSGTTNYIPKWTDGDTIGDSIIYDSGSKIGIGTTAPLGILSLPGADTTTKPQIRFQTGAAANLADAAISTTDDSGGTNVMIGANQYWSGGSITRFVTDRSGSAIDFGYAGRMKFYTGEGSAAPTERMRIERDGNVGIGTDSPDDKLHILGTSSDTAGVGLLAIEGGGGNVSWVFRSTATGDDLVLDREYGGAGSYYNVLAIKRSNGNVGIGTTDPGYLLDVNGTANIGGALTVGAGLNVTGDTAITGKYLSSVDGERLQIGSTSNGRGAVVGSKVYLPGGTTSQLEYSAYWAYDAYFDNSTRTWKSMRTNLGRKWKMEAGYHIAQMKFSFSSASDPISWSDLLIIDNSGAIQFNNYGSGSHTGTSAYKLSVDSSGNIIETSIGSGAVDGAGTTNYIPKWTDGDTIGNSVIVESSSKIGIGTATPGATLQIGTHSNTIPSNTALFVSVNPIRFSTTNNNADYGSYLKPGYDAGPNPDVSVLTLGTRFNTTDTDVLTLYGNKVGIGTAVPGAKLHVYGGNIRISSTDDKPQLEFFETAAARWVIGHSNAPNNYFAISEGSDVAASERLVIAPTTGSVGIGTTSPGTLLEVNGTFKAGGNCQLGDSYSDSHNIYGQATFLEDGSEPNNIYLRNTTNGSGASIAFTDQGTPAQWGYIRYFHADSQSNGCGNSIHFDSSETSTAVVIDQTTGDSGFYVGDIITIGNSNYQVAIRGGADSYFMGGNLGIGTRSPAGNLVVVAPAGADALVRIIAAQYATEKDARLYIGENDTLGMTLEYDGVANIGYIGMNNSVDPTGAWSKRIQMTRAGTEVSFMAGSVGIGNAEPVATLEVRAASPKLLISNSTYQGSAWDTESQLAFKVNHSDDDERIKGAIIFKNQANDYGVGDLLFCFEAASDNANVTSANEKVRFQSDGNVGIGTTNPGELLEVGADGNTDYALIGPTKIGAGMGHGDYAGFSHRSMGGTTNYCLLQNPTGITYLNAASGKNIYFRNNNTTVFSLNGSLATFDVSALFNGYIELDAGLKDKDGSFGTSGYVLTTDGSGDVTWSASPGAGSVDGSGTDNYVPRWNGTTALQNSALFSNDSGSVGIGTNAPGEALDIVFSEGVQVNLHAIGPLRLENTADATGIQCGIAFVVNNASSDRAWAGIYSEQDNTDDSKMNFWTETANSRTVKMTIANDGKVGIGTTAPSNSKLDVSGGHVNISDGSGIVWGGGSNRPYIIGNKSNGTLEFGEGGTEHFRMGTTGAMQFNSYGSGTHTGTAAYKLSVTSGGNIIETAIGAGAVDGAGTANYITRWTDGDTIGDSVVYETAAGTIGIHAGTNVEGMVDVQMKMNGVDWTYGDWDEVWCTGGAPGPKFNDCVFHLDTDRAGGVTGGIVGLAFSPGWQGHQNWGIYSTNEFGGSHTQGDLRFVNQLNTPAGTFNERVTFKADGNVGIGTTAPGSYKLRVEGNVYISGTLTEASSLAIKENIETYSPSLEMISKIRPVRYNKKKSKKKEVGLVAEELVEMFPELVEMDEKGNAVGVNYSRAVAVLLHGFKELYKEVKELKEKI